MEACIGSLDIISTKVLAEYQGKPLQTNVSAHINNGLPLNTTQKKGTMIIPKGVTPSMSLAKTVRFLKAVRNYIVHFVDRLKSHMSGLNRFVHDAMASPTPRGRRMSDGS